VQILLHCQSCYQIIRLCHICLQAKQAHKDLILDDDDDSFPSLPLWETCLELDLQEY
jgi:hypothetical protein